MHHFTLWNRIAIIIITRIIIIKELI